jgi:hypothetical protein
LTLRFAEHTVQSHLKSVFDKFGVRSRGQLLAAVFGAHYLPLVTDPGRTRQEVPRAAR